MAKGFIYGIINPINNELRYIGQTVNMCKRKSSHKRMALKTNNNSYVYNWLRSLYNNSVEPEFIILDITDIQYLDDLEIFYIGYFKMLGCNLTNSVEGGKSKRGNKHSIESRRKRSLRMKGNTYSLGFKPSEETKLKMSESHKGLRHTQKSKDKVSKVNIKHIKVVQLTLKGETIKVFSSAYEASKELKINRKSIGNVLAGRAKTAGNFMWKYY